MIDYLERLEAELMRAARAEEARTHRFRTPRVRIPVRAVAGLGAAAAAAALAITVIPRQPEVVQRAARPGPPPAAVVGSYSRGSDALIIDPDRYTLDTGTQELIGDVTSQQGTLIFAAGTTGPCARLGVGRYTYTVSAGRLELRPLQDPCDARETALTSGSWRRDGS